MATFGNRFRAARMAANLTQEQLGLEIGVSKQAVSDWENGRQYPNTNLWPNLRAQLGVSLDHLICGDRPRRVQEEGASYGEPLPPDLRRLLELGRRLTPRKLKLLVTFLDK